MKVTPKQAEIETSLAEKELDEWRRARQTTYERGPTQDLLHDSSSDLLQRRLADLKVSPSRKPETTDRSYTVAPPSKTEYLNVHVDCISKSEHERVIQSLVTTHSKQVEEERGRMLDTLNTKIQEFEQSCTEQYKAKIKTLEARSNTSGPSSEVAELRAQLQSAKLSEDMIRRKYEGQLALSEQTLQEYRQRLAKAEQGQDADLKVQLESKVRELRHMEERVRKLETDDSSHSKYEEERRRRERLEDDYKRIAMELTEEKLRNKREVEGDLKLKLKELEFVNQKLKREHSNLMKVHKRTQKGLQSLEEEKAKWENAKRMKSPIRSGTITPRNKAKAEEATISLAAIEKKKQHLSEEVTELESKRNHLIESIQTRDWEDLRSFYEKKCLDLSDEVFRWKEKTTSLVSKFYTALKKLKREGKQVKAEVGMLKEQMETEVTNAVETVRGRYETALGRGERHTRSSAERAKRDTSAGRRRPPKPDSSFG